MPLPAKTDAAILAIFDANPDAIFTGAELKEIVAMSRPQVWRSIANLYERGDILYIDDRGPRGAFRYALNTNHNRGSAASVALSLAEQGVTLPRSGDKLTVGRVDFEPTTGHVVLTATDAEGREYRAVAKVAAPRKKRVA